MQTIWGHLSYFLYDFKLYIALLIFSFFLIPNLAIKVFRSNHSEKYKKIMLAILASLLFFVIIYSGIEAFFRYRYDQSDGLGFLQTNARWMGRHVVFNTYGFRDRDFNIKKANGVVRIGVLGDSLTMGYGIKNVNYRFSNIIERKLNANGIKAEVYNLGQSGADTCSEIKEFLRVKQLKFDLVIWEYFINDVQPCEKSTGEQVLIKEAASENKILRFIRDESFFFDFIYYRFSSVHKTTYQKLRDADLAQYHHPKILKHHLGDVASLSATLKRETTMHEAIVVFFPSLFLLNKNYPAKDINVKMDAFFKKQGVSLLDLLPYLIDKSKHDLVVNRFDSHPNEYVNDMVANLLYGRIVNTIRSKK